MRQFRYRVTIDQRPHNLYEQKPWSYGNQAIINLSLELSPPREKMMSHSYCLFLDWHGHFFYCLYRFGADLGYWPLVQTPGVAYIVNTGAGQSPASVLNNTLVSSWPTVLLVFVTSLLAGLFIWILVSFYRSTKNLSFYIHISTEFLPSMEIACLYLNSKTWKCQGLSRSNLSLFRV